MHVRLVLIVVLLTCLLAATRSTVSTASSQHPRLVYDYVTKGLLCIHKYEGAWNNHDTGGTGHYGGLQMDYSFMRHYGYAYYQSWGTADHWAPYYQIQAARRAYFSGRGWYPWPNTARYCGLI